MPLIYILVGLIIISILVSLLLNPYVWLFVLVLMGYSWFKRNVYLNNSQKNKENYYYQDKKQTSNDDVIDVSYTVVEEEK